MTLDEWQSNPELAVELRKLLTSPVMQAALSICESMSPSRQVMAMTPETAVNSAQFQLGCIKGFQQWKLAFDELAEERQAPRTPREDYNTKPNT